MREDIYQRLIALTEEEEKILNGEENVNKSLYTDNGEFIVDSRKLLQTGELIDIRRHTRFVRFPKHKHNYIEFNYVYKGQLTQNIDDRKITLKQGELIFLNQYITHEIEASEEEDIIINFIIKPEFFDYIITLLDDENLISKFLLTTLYKDYSEGEYLYFKVADKNYIQELAEKIITELYEPSIMSKATIKLLVGLLLVELVKRSKDIETYSANNYDKLLIIQSFKYIDKYYKNANLFELAKKLNQPHYKLSKLIKKHTKMTFKELLQEKKLSKAIELLKLTEYSIVEIIDLIGYENPTYFYKIFKEKYGVTPKEYRGKKLYED
ncbi:AraC family transcriptional regulator [Clostridium fungisolvens]|uniref:HTH-type transcriptional activator RhaS n=1 Tax=Clostridium fungisolvens TaxID=1604897 RepID=A0A6V8SIY2_9CLOT|nr:AraC family transcriptional regulator [Clostridium fungisolvens]GFP74853.1 HTH-type transcriptional activator RhaS [Clostridium fungisolvens]